MNDNTKNTINFQNYMLMKYFLSFWFLLLWMNTSISLKAQCTGVSESDSLELVNFYQALDGDNWTNNEGWLVEPLENWFGIKLWYVEDSSQCYISRIVLPNNNLSGTLPELNLDNLLFLILNENNLAGNLPSFSQASELTTIDLSNNQIEGTISDFNLPDLLTLKLDSNSIGGVIPNFSNTPRLRHLHIYGNELTGNIPDFSNTVELRAIRASYNQLSGNIPDFSLIWSLDTLDLSNNQLTGTIPDFSHLTSLEDLFLRENQLSGNIPNFSNLQNLDNLDLVGNQLTGTIPTFENVSKISLINLGANQLTGTIPNFDLPFLTVLAVNNNQLTGTIPNFDKTPRLLAIFVHNNQLTGYVPDFKQLPLLQLLWVCPGNNLLAPIPNFIDFLLFDYEVSKLDCIPNAVITGKTFNDLNQNCLQDENEQALPNTKITVNDSLHHTYSDENGFYKLQLDTGTYQITATPPNFLWSEPCPEPYTIILENYNDSIPNKDFGFEVEDECTLLTIDVASPLQRRCFTNTYTISYCNEGTKSADSAYVELTFPPEIIPLSASIPHVENESGNVWSFDLDTLAIGECGSFTVVDSVSCEAVLGSAACVEGRIYPAFLCRDVSTLWDGSNIEVTGECIDNEFIEFTITNIGEDMQDSTEYRIYEDDILSSLDKVKLMSGGSEALQIAATGATYRLKAEQAEFHPFESIPQVVVELCGEEPYSLGFVTSQPNSDLEHFIDIDCQEIIGSFDPNDKQVHPVGIADQHYIAEGTELTYKIRFQNTGNDTAFRVTIIDTLHSDYLDLQTFEITSTSHPYNARIANQNVLIVEFDNILLPDSTTNELESHGFVQYRITPFEDAPKNSIVTNLGDIYFDYNQPITTNTVFNTIGIPLLDVTLPIELLQFNAYLDENQNGQLTWITASEINNSHFEVQRSIDGRHFAAIGKMEGKGTTSELHSYQFEDSNLPSTTSTVYYRLKQIDFNGQYSYSKVISLSLQNKRATKVWYNAAQNNLEVVAAEALQLQIYDATGRLLKSVGIMKGKQKIDVGNLASGVYAYQLLQSGLLNQRQQGKLLIVRN